MSQQANRRFQSRAAFVCVGMGRILLNLYGDGRAERVFEKFHPATIRFSMRRVAAISIMVSEVCTLYS
jgi:hypothetical protein